MSWQRTTLGDVCEVVGGATPKTGQGEFWGGDIPWATPKDLSDLEGAHEIASTPRSLTVEGLRSCAAKVLPAGSVLLSSRAPIGHVAINTVPMATNQGFKSLIPDRSRVDAKFLFWWLRRNRPLLESLGTGATFKEISKKTTAAVPIDLPPLDEQRRIAAILDAADTLQANRRQAREKLDTLTRAIFIDMFGDPARTEAGAAFVLGDVAQIITGNTPPRSSPELYGEHLEWLKSDNILESGDISVAVEGLSEAGARKGRRAPAGSTLVVCIAGSRRSIGRAGLLDRPAAFNQQINAVVPGPDVLPRYLFTALRLLKPVVQQASTNSMKGMVSKSALSEVRVPIPSLASQERFIERASCVDLQREAVHRSTRHLNMLADSLRQRAFAGGL